MSAMRFELAISQEGPEPQSLGAIESILLIGCLHKMRSHLAEDPSFQSLTWKIHGSSMDFPSERGVPFWDPNWTWPTGGGLWTCNAWMDRSVVHCSCLFVSLGSTIWQMSAVPIFGAWRIGN